MHPLYRWIVLSGVSSSLLVFACGKEPSPKAPSPEPVASATEAVPPPETPQAPVATASAEASSVANAPAAPKEPITVEDMAPSPNPEPLPTVKIKAPANEVSVGDATKAKDYQVRLDVKNWPTEKGKNHVHLILDNHPYKAIYDTKAPVKLVELLPAGVELSEGQHVLTSFPSRATHESVKAKGSVSVVTFWVGKRGKATLDTKKPYLIYSRPKGDNFGEMAKNILIDFYLLNTTLDKGEKVTFSLTGTGIEAPVTGEFKAWAPKVIRHLPAGEFEMKLELLDKDGKPVSSPLNPTTRKFKVDPEGKE